MYDNQDASCPFCKIQHKPNDNNVLSFAIEDKYPVTKFHTLVLPKRHVASFFELSSSEQRSCLLLLESMKEKIKKKDSSVTGFNIGINDGQDAGQTAFHCHIHLIPRRKGDVSDPRGGVRHTIPGKGFYQR